MDAFGLMLAGETNIFLLLYHPLKIGQRLIAPEWFH